MSGFLGNSGSISVVGLVADGYVAFFDNSDQPTGEYNFFWDADANELRITDGDIAVTNGQVFIDNGSAAVPGLSTLDGHGLFRKSASQLGIAVSGGEVGYFDSSDGGKLHTNNLSASDIVSSNRIGLADGTAASPSLYFASDDDGSGTGIYRYGVNDIGFSANGMLKVRITGAQLDTYVNYDSNNYRITNSLGPLNLGNAYTTTKSLETGSVVIGSDTNSKSLEVEGVSYFESLIFTRDIAVNSGDDIYGTFSTGVFRPRASAQTVNAMAFGTGTGSNYMLIAEYQDLNFDFAHPKQTNPTVFIHSANQATDEWILIAHDQTDAVIGVGKGGLKIEGQIFSPVPATLEPSGTTQTVDFNNGNSQVLELNGASGDVTLTLSNGKSGGSYIIKFIQSSVARQLVWPASVLWEGGTAPTLTATEDALDVITLWFDGTNYFGSYLLNLS